MPRPRLALPAIAALCLAGLARMAGAAPAHAAPDFARQVLPLIEKYCVSCHNPDKKKGDLSLDGYRTADEATLLKAVHVWQSVAERMEGREMPPEEQPQPTDAEVELILSWVEWAEGRVAAEGKRDPGRVTIRRLNRAEYNNTIRDLLGLDIKPANDFPSDDVGYGFDNIGDVLSMPPILVERYMAAAERIAERAIVAEVEPRFRTHLVQVERLAPTPPGSLIRGGALVMTEGGSVRAPVEFPVDAEYSFRVKAFGRASGREPARLTLRVEGKEIKTIDVRAPAVYTIRGFVEAGQKRVELAFANPVPRDPTRPPPERHLGLDFLRVEGPHKARARALPESHTRIIPRRPTKESWRDDAREFLAVLASRAFRRPVQPAEVERLVKFVERSLEEGDTFERGMQVALRAVLVSPHFLYRVEMDQFDPQAASEARPLGDYELANRLSYFLWASMPDDELFRLAADGSLRQPEVLETQVRRMLQDAKARALVENFATQWLQIRNLATHRPSRRHFPRFDDDLRAAMLRETELFFEAVVKEDLPLLTLLDADFTFLNERLARHYGIEGVEGSAFRRVSLAGTPRGGLLTHGSILTVTSNPTRTSPVKRGRWVLEQLLGTPPPPPPPDVPELRDDDRRDGAKATSLRERLEEHRKDPNCAVCHRKMDPLGLGLENFDAVGAWRTVEPGGHRIDASGVLPNGQSFDGPVELKSVLKTKETAFRRSLAQKLLTYALGRGTEPFDRASIDEICQRTVEGGDTLGAMVLAIVKSDPFLKRRGEAEP